MSGGRTHRLRAYSVDRFDLVAQLEVAPGTATTQDITNLLDAVSDIYVSCGGHGLVFEEVANNWFGRLIQWLILKHSRLCAWLLGKFAEPVDEQVKQDFDLCLRETMRAVGFLRGTTKNGCNRHHNPNRL